MKINFFWIGEHLSKMCQLSLKSFIDNDHEVVLWTYNKKYKNIPSGVLIEDAGQILHPSKIFTYTGNGDCRNGSYGGFSDIFRYHLLQNEGGWYCDMDVTCLKNFEEISNEPYVFRPHKIAKQVGNIMKCVKNNNFLKHCIEITEKKIDKNNGDWIKPVFLLNESIETFNLEKYTVSKEFFGNDDIEDLKCLLEIPFTNKIKPPKYAIHWCNEIVSTGQWINSVRRNWDKPIPTTLYYKLLKKHNLL